MPGFNLLKMRLDNLLKALYIFSLLVFSYLLFNYINQPIWSDEAYSLLVIKQDFLNLIIAQSKETSPPLYFLFAKFYSELFGYSILSVRLVSVTATLLILLIFRVYITNKSLSYISSILLLLNTNIFYFSIEARYYTPLMLLTIWSFFSTNSFINKQTNKNFALVVLSNISLLYIHSLGIIIFGTNLLLYAKAFKTFKNRKNLNKYILAVLLTGLAFAPWAFVMYFQIKQQQGLGFWLEFKPTEFWKHLLGIVELTRYYWGKPLSTQLVIFSQSFTISTITLLTIGAVKAFKAHKEMLVPFLNIIVFFLISFFFPIFFYRYLLFLIPFVVILQAIGFKWIIKEKRIHFLLKILVIVLLVLSKVFFISNFATVTNPNLVDKKELIETYLAKDYKIYTSEDLLLYVYKYYFNEAHIINDSSYINRNIGVSIFNDSDVVKSKDISDNKILYLSTVTDGTVLMLVEKGYVIELQESSSNCTLTILRKG